MTRKPARPERAAKANAFSFLTLVYYMHVCLSEHRAAVCRLKELQPASLRGWLRLRTEINQSRTALTPPNFVHRHWHRAVSV